jgi:membrane-associated protease RseP (regulator of RpoE activity)
VIWNRNVFRAAACSLALGLLAATGAAHADASTPDDKDPGAPVTKRKVVIVDKDGKQKVWEGEGPMVRRGYFGVALLDLTSELRTHFGVPDDSGVMVSKVEPGSPAEKAGVRVGDILTRLDGQAVKSAWAVTAKARGLEEGQQIAWEVWRNGKAQNLNLAVVLKERPEVDMAPFFKDGDGEPLMLKINSDDWKGFGDMGDMKDGQAMKRLQVRRIGPSREADLEKQLKDLEKRIAELEAQLKKK